MDLCSLPRSLRPSMLSLFCVSQFLLGSNLCCGFLIRLFHRGALLIRCGVLLFRRGAPLIHRGVLLIRRGALLHCLLRRGGLLPCLLRTGGLLPCLLCTCGLLLCLLRRGGRLSHSGGLLSRSGGPLLRRGGLLLRLLRSGGHLLRRGGLLLRSGGLLLCRGDLLLRTGWLLSRPLCLNPHSLHFHMDLALRPSPCSASAPPPSWIVLECLEAAPCEWALSRIRSVAFHPIATRGRLHHIDSHTTQHTGPHFPSSIALTTHTQLITLITLTPENYHTITITQSHMLYKPWTFSL